jgi:outer membrane immunogenic protein
MKRFLFTVSAIALALSAGSALAADLPSRKEAPVYVPPPPPPPMWTGFYVGLNAGGTFGGTNSVTTAGGPIGVFNPVPGSATALTAATIATSALGAASNTTIPGLDNGSFIAGGQIGYNYQFNNAFVVGLEADIQGLAGSSGSSNVSSLTAVSAFGVSDNIYSAASANKSLDYLGTVRGRIGYLFTPTLLAYATGGLAYGGANLSSSFFAADTAGLAQALSSGSSYSDTRVGWTVGGGLEWLFAPNWSAKLEYLYYDLGAVTTPASASLATLSVPAGAPFGAIAQQSSAQFNGHIVRAGLNYHFNWGIPAPVVAKY